METIRGRTTLELDSNELRQRLADYARVLLDLGTGDGRYVHHLAERHPGWFMIGMDSCRENLREHSRAKLPNLLFVIASAQRLPRELNGRVSHVTINFPWGSLLESLLEDDSALLRGLEALSGPAASMEICLNGGALAEAGWTLEAGAAQIYENLLRAGWQLKGPDWMSADELRSFPSTWARRLAFGRDARALKLSGPLAR